MEIIKEKKFLKLLLILGIAFSSLFLLGTKGYAASNLSVKYSGKEVKTNTYLNLSMKYKNNPITWNISSSGDWTVYSSDNKVIKITQDHKKNTIKITPISPTAQDGKAEITIATKNKSIIKKYYIKVQDYLSVQMNNKELPTNQYIKLNHMAARYVGVLWKIDAPNGWTVVSHDNNLISINQDHNSNYILIWALPRKYGKAKITITTKDKKISRTYLIDLE